MDDNYRVKKGDLLVQLDKEPYEVQVQIKQAAVKSSEADLAAAQAQVRGQVAQARANRFKLEHAIEDVGIRLGALHSDGTNPGPLARWISSGLYTFISR